MMSKKIKQQGLTLVELVVAIALFVVLSLGVISLVSIMLTTVRQQGGLLADSESARKVAYEIISELRNSTASSIGAYALDTAGDQTIVFYSNVDGGSDIEKVRYFIQNGQLIRGVIKPSGDPLVYNIANETTFIVQKNIANGVNRLFYYYNGTYDGGADSYLTQPINVTQVKYVKMKMQVYNKAGVKNQTSYTITVGGAIRNLKDNLGN